jgi:hypothetical protein
MKTLIIFALLFSTQLFARELPKQLMMTLKSFSTQTNAKDAFAQLMKQAKKDDPKKKGILILFKAKKNKEINLNLSQMPLIEIIRYMCISSDYSFKVTGRTVIISDK